MGSGMKPGGAGGRRKKDVRREVPKMDDPATAWARDVADGKIVAAKPVVDACHRHLADLEDGRFLWDPSQGARFADFCRLICRVTLPTGGRVPFTLLPWQTFCAYSLLSWRVKKNDPLGIPPGARRYRYGFILTAKGSGKSPFGAAFGMYMMTADHYVPLEGRPVRENEPQCYVLASTIEQAEAVGIRHAFSLIESSPQLKRDMGIKMITAHPQSVVSTTRASFLRAVGLQSKQGGAAGLNPHYIQWEEMHEQKDRVILDDFVAGFKGRPQPMLLMLTNAARSKQSMAHDEYLKAKAAAKGHKSFPTYFAFVAECSETDIPKGGKRWWPSERHWEKANPSLGITIRKDIINDRIANAQSEVDRIDVKRLYFSIWSEHNEEFISEEAWKAAEVDPFDDDVVAGGTLYLAVDTASKNDMCSFAYLWKCMDGKWRLRVRYYSPEDGFEDRAQASNGKLIDWREEGWIKTPAGGVLSMAMVAKEIKAAVDNWGCRHVVLDTYRFKEVLVDLREAGQRWWMCEDARERMVPDDHIEIVQHPMRNAKTERVDGRDLWMEGSINAFETLIKGLDGGGPTIEIERNPVLRWNRASAVVKPDMDLNRRFDKINAKNKMHGKIDGLVAATMAVGVGVIEDALGGRRSPWDDPSYRWY